MIECLVVGAGGFVGAVLRYLVGLLDMNPESGFPHRCGGGAGVPGGLESSDGAFSEGGNLRGVYHVLFLRTGKPRFDDERRFRHSTHVHGGEPGIGNSGGVHRPAHVRRLRGKKPKEIRKQYPIVYGNVVQ